MTKNSSASRKSSTRSRCIVMFCVGWLTMASSALAADDNPGPPTPLAVPEIEVLLSKVEDQVAAGHAVSPAQDSGIKTWKRVLDLEVASPDSPVVRVALTAFMARMRNRAAAEQAAGRVVVASDLTLFAEQAKRLLESHRANPSPPVATSSIPTPVATTSVPGRDARPPTEATGATTVPAPLSLGGHPPPDASSGPGKEATAPVPSNGPPGNQFEPTPSSAPDGVGTNTPVPTATATAEVPDASTPAADSTPAPSPHRHRAPRHPYKPWPPLTELPVMLPPAPAPRPPLFARIFNWLQGQKTEAAR